MSVCNFFISGNSSALRTTTKAQDRSGKPSAAITRGCNSPACATAFPSTRSSAQRPGCHGAKSELVVVETFPVSSMMERANPIASTQVKSCALPFQLLLASFPATTPPTCNGWLGTLL